jgi:hypothetical protein
VTVWRHLNRPRIMTELKRRKLVYVLRQEQLTSAIRSHVSELRSRVFWLCCWDVYVLNLSPFNCIPVRFYLTLNYLWPIREFSLAECPLASLERARSCSPYGLRPAARSCTQWRWQQTAFTHHQWIVSIVIDELTSYIACSKNILLLVNLSCMVHDLIQHAIIQQILT